MADGEQVVGEQLAGGRLAELYSAHAPGAFKLAYLLTGDRSAAEDLVQDAFVKLVGRFVDLRERDSFQRYLNRTVVNLTRSRWRKQEVRRRHAERATRDVGAFFDADLAERATLWGALDALSPRQRGAIVLRYYEDYSEREIAEALRCRPGTVKSLIHRGLEELRKAELR